MSTSSAARGEASLRGKHALLVSHRPTALFRELARSLVQRGASVTLALRHTQDGHYAVKHVLKQLPQEIQHSSFDTTDAGLVPATGLSSSSTPLNMANLASIREFAAILNSKDEPLHVLVLDTWDLHAAGTKDSRWYTKEGLAGTTQTAFLGPAVLLHLLQPKLASNGTAVLLTASPSHRLAPLKDLQPMLTSWAHSTSGATQTALMAYVRRLALQLSDQGVRAAAVDLGVLSEQPLKGSLVRKLPVLHQVLHTLLPSARDASRLLTDVAAHMLSHSAGMGGIVDVVGQEVSAACMESGPADNSAVQPNDQAGLAGHLACSPAGTPLFEQKGELSAQPPAGAAPAPAGPLAGAGQDDSSSAIDVAPQEHVTDARPDHATAFDMGSSLGLASVVNTSGPVQQAASANSPVTVTNASAQSKTAAPMSGLATSAQVEGSANMAVGSRETINSLSEVVEAGPALKPFSYISRGLLAHPLISALDHAGSSTWTSRTLHTLTTPLYDLASTTLITAAELADWPVRALLLNPAGLLARLGPLGAWASHLGSQLQRLMPGVVAVPAGISPLWVEVLPSGAVLDDKLGWRLWHLVDQYAALR